MLHVHPTFDRNIIAALLAFASVPAWAGTIAVTDNGTASPATCTLAQAIYAANLANNPTGARPPGATTIDPLSDSAATTAGIGSCTDAASGANTIDLANFAGRTFTYTTPDNFWYGPNALPPIASTITIEGRGVTLSVGASVTRLRFFFVGADAASAATSGYNTPGPGNLTLHQLTLSGGKQRGGSGNGGGGGGMGGAMFNQGTASLDSVTMKDNSAIGGSGATSVSEGGGGMAGDGGMGGTVPSGLGDAGGSASGGSAAGAGGGNFNGLGGGLDGGGDGSGTGGYGGYKSEANPGGGGGGGLDGGSGGVSDGAGIGGAFGANGSGNFHGGGGGGGGAGGGGGTGVPFVGQHGGGGGGGGFGGGGGTGQNRGGDGGFGGGAGSTLDSTGEAASPGFAGGNRDLASAFCNCGGGGGGGLGGALFNFAGTLTLLNCTFTANDASGGSGGTATATFTPSQGGDGYGGAIFNLNGTLNVSFSTLTGNRAIAGSGGTKLGGGATGAPGISDGGAIYNLGYLYGTLNATVKLRSSILSGSVDGNGAIINDLANDKPTFVTHGGQNGTTATIVATGVNLVERAKALNDAGSVPTASGSWLTVDPQLGTLTNNNGPVQTMLPQTGSPAIDGAGNCNDAATHVVHADARGLARPQGAKCDLGAVEVSIFTDRVFADNFDGTPTP